MYQLLAIIVHRTLSDRSAGLINDDGSDSDFGLQHTDELVILDKNSTYEIKHRCLTEAVLSDNDINVPV